MNPDSTAAGRLAGKRVFITGAGSGLGKALALRFAADGWRVAVTDVDLAAAQQTLGEVQAAGGSGFAEVCNVTSEESFAAVAARLQSEWNGVDVLVNNAGVATKGTVAESTIEQWQWVLNINLLGCVRGARAVIPLLTAQRGGHIVNIASFAGIANPPAMASYNAAKAAVISLSETLRHELEPHGVGVSVACPSFFKTNLIASSRQASPEHGDEPSPQMDRIVQRLMEKASITADSVAADIFDAVREQRFLVLVNADDKRQVLIKRVSPEFYFRMVQKATAKFMQKKA
ncbi:MAG: SDR family oxidoreductase [Nevskia sp.]|nr:SDR family oxidoreductase [Nevskia sp.]